MILKQKVLKEERFKFIILNSIPLAVLLIIGIINKCQNGEVKTLVAFTFILWLPFFILHLAISFAYLEWFLIYNDRIEARCLWGMKNVVYYQNILSVELTRLNLTARGMEKDFYILHDGRTSTNSIIGRISCYNRKKYSFRIYKTNELEAFLQNMLHDKMLSNDKEVQ